MRHLTYLLLFCPALLIGQATFQRYFELDGNDVTRSAVMLSPDRLVMVGSSQDSNGLTHCAILVLDGEGALVSSATIDYPLRTMGEAIARQSDSTFWMGAWRSPIGIVDDWVVYRVNAYTGEATGFGWGAENVDEQIRAMEAMPDGGVTVVGNTGDLNEAIISRLDADGNELFRKGFSIPGNLFTIFTDVELLPDGDLLTAGQFRSESSFSGYFLAKISAAGELIWSRQYNDEDDPEQVPSGAISLCVLPGGNVVLADRHVQPTGRKSPLALLINSDGTLRSANRYLVILTSGGTSRPGFAQGLRALADGGFLLFGAISSLSEENETGFAIRLGAEAELRDWQFYESPGENTITGGFPDGSGGFWLYGHGAICPGGGNDDFLLLRTNENLEVADENCEVTDRTIVQTELNFRSASTGQLFDRDDPRFTPPPLMAVGAEFEDKICPRVEVVPQDLSSAICYESPFRLLESARVLSAAESVTTLGILLVGAAAGAGEFLRINDPGSAIITGNGTTEIQLRISESMSQDELVALLSQLEYGIMGELTDGGLRSIRIGAAKACLVAPPIEFDFIIVPNQEQTINLPQDTLLCPEDTLVLNPATVGATDFRWSTGVTTPMLTVSQPGTYGLTVTNACRRDSAVATVSEAESRSLPDEELREIICLGDSLNFNPTTDPAVSYRWEDGADGPARTFREAGIYTLLKANACYEATTTLEVCFQDCCLIYYPNAFSPNGDGVNDRFMPAPSPDDCRAITDWSFHIFNRWGAEVFATEDRFSGWDGSFRERPAENGVYVFELRYFNGQETVAQSGSVMLLR